MKMKRFVAVVLVLVMALSLFANGAKEIAQPQGKYAGRHLGLCWCSLGIEFYANLADLIKGQAEADGIKVTVTDANWDVSKQLSQLENLATMGCTDIIIIPIDQDALRETLKNIRKNYGINVHSFAYDFGGDIDCYDTVSVADQYIIGKAQADAATAWVDKKYPNAAAGSIKVAMVTLPTTTDDKLRDSGCRDGIKADPRMKLVEEVEVFEQDYATAQNALDSILLKHPDINIVVFHFATMAEGADERAMTLTTIDKENFAIISGDNNRTLLDRIKNSRKGKSLVRGSGAYDVNATSKLYGITMGEFADQIDAKKRFVFETYPITTDNVDQFTANI